ncbi:MAG: cupredoxin domain-containing protein, partial [Acidimicrobiia bacterium]
MLEGDMGNAATFVVAAFGLAVAPAVPSWAGADSGDGRMTETAAAATSSSSVPTNQGPRCNAVGDGRGTQISVTLDEWSVEPDPASAPPGKTTFRATNDGLEPHELVIVKGDDPAALPVQDNLVDEDSLPEGAFVGEIEEFRAGSRCPGTFELDPGPYVLFCNIENHYQDGMYAGFTVAAPPPPAAEPEAGAAPDPPSATPPAATAPTRE